MAKQTPKPPKLQWIALERGQHFYVRHDEATDLYELLLDDTRHNSLGEWKYMGCFDSIPEALDFIQHWTETRPPFPAS